jgi:hypothetical protein
MHSAKYNKTNHKTQFMSTATFYMFRLQGAITREFLTLLMKVWVNSTQNTCWTYDPLLLQYSLRMALSCRNMQEWELEKNFVSWFAFYCILLSVFCWLTQCIFKLKLVVHIVHTGLQRVKWTVHYLSGDTHTHVIGLVNFKTSNIFA